MAQKRRFLDVWIVEGNTVYREVPFTVVCDWVQQGRLLEDDMLRPSGTAQWFRLGGMPAFAAYLPKSSPFRAEDKAEALERVEFDFAWKRRPDDEEDDVDMIPLIDVSLVLLIFFMMISSVAAAAGQFIKPAPIVYGVEVDPKTTWVGVQSKDGNILYSIGDERQVIPLNGDQKETLDRRVVLDALKDVAKDQTAMPVRIRSDGEVPCEVVVQLIEELQKMSPHVGRLYKDGAEPEQPK